MSSSVSWIRSQIGSNANRGHNYRVTMPRTTEDIHIALRLVDVMVILAQSIDRILNPDDTASLQRAREHRDQAENRAKDRSRSPRPVYHGDVRDVEGLHDTEQPHEAKKNIKDDDEPRPPSHSPPRRRR